MFRLMLATVVFIAVCALGCSEAEPPPADTAEEVQAATTEPADTAEAGTISSEDFEDGTTGSMKMVGGDEAADATESEDDGRSPESPSENDGGA